ncbi:unnamed protein product, partial [Phaeothamnion confervicola]
MLNLEDSFTFYASYHNNAVNQAIHIFCIWPIFFTALGLGRIYLPGCPAPPALAAALEPWVPPEALALHAGLAFVAVTVFAYPIMDPVIGTVGALLSVACYLVSNVLAPRHAAIFGAVHVAGWLAQFWGHGVHEGRAPALLDSLFQAIFIAPLFVLLAIAF